MKKILCTLAIVAGSLLSLSAAELKLPVYWKANTKTPGKYQTTAFAYLADKENVYFAFQIQDLTDLIREKNPAMACYFNTDNNVMTGRFSKAYGWDMQINARLQLKTPYVIHWIGNKESTLKNQKDGASTRIVGDIVLITVKKSLIKPIPFKEKFVVRQFQNAQGYTAKITGIDRCVVDPAKKLGEITIKD